MRRFSAFHLDQDINQSGFADVFGGVWSFGLQPAAFSFFGFPGGHFAVSENNLHRSWFDDVIPAGRMCVHRVFFARGKSVFDDAHVGVFQDDFVVLGSEFDDVLSTSDPRKGE